MSKIIDPNPRQISVQVITLNEETHIADCLEKILQNNPGEILVIDGGSTDKTVKIAQGMGATVIVRPNLGRGESRKLGYMSTDFPFVAMIDADDRIPPGWLSEMLEELVLGKYEALQSGIKVSNLDGFYARGWNAYFFSSLKPSRDSKMVGHPALYRLPSLKLATGNFGHEGEDTQLSKCFQNLGLRQGISQLKCERLVPESRQENFTKWQGYGRGYFEFVRLYPARLIPILYHMWFRIPIVRGLFLTRFNPRLFLFHLYMSTNISIGFFKRGMTWFSNTKLSEIKQRSS